MSALYTKQKFFLGAQPHTMVYNLTPLVPLSLDRVLGDEPVTSTLPIFQLPIELITHIAPHLSSLDIGILALVDRDANQLARTLQFSNVKLDYSDRALDLLAKLKSEAHSQSVGRRIVACIRRLTVSSTRDSSNALEGMDVHDPQVMPLQERLRRIKSAKQTEAEYLRSICDLLPYLPNLHVLEWNDEGPLTSEMMRCMMSSSLVHLRLDGPILDSPLTLPSPCDGVGWALETLLLNVGWSLTTPIPGNSASFISGLLRLTAPTLRQLVWLGYADQLSPPCRTYEGGTHFPDLRDVVLNRVNFKDSNFLRRVLDKRTLIQSLSVDSSPVVSQFLVQRGRISSLVSLRWSWCGPDSYDDIIQFTHDNSHISCLEVTSPLPPTIIDTILLQHNVPHFDNLVVLHLAFDGQDFPDESLKTITLIESLRHLWLSAGVQCGTRHQWVVDHTLMVSTLRPLSRLKTLAFTRDSYRVDGHPLLDTSAERYYMNKVLPHDLLLNDYLTDDELNKANSGTDSFERSMYLRDSLRSLAWERWHQSQMVMFATEYSRVFRDLQWCFIGQLLMWIEDHPLWRIAELNVRERDPMLKTLYAYWDCIVKSQ